MRGVALAHRYLTLIHRYVGMVIGIVMAMWCLSGVVMMYVGYPDLSEPERLHALPPLNRARCCVLPDSALADNSQVGSFQVEMLGTRPVLRLRTSGGGASVVDLSNGQEISSVPASEARLVAQGFGGAPELRGILSYDQWTVAEIPEGERPLYQFALDDSAGTFVYVSTVSGRTVQVTTARQRFWNWLGAVPHWLYFAELRRNGALWNQVVVYASTVGCFLALLGIYLGIYAFMRTPGRRWSAYRGWLHWHHLPGLIFGVLVLTWVLSGLLSMNPWGLLEGSGARAEQRKLQGEPITGAQVKKALSALTGLLSTGEIASLRSAPLGGKLYLVATTELGSRIRLDAYGVASPVTTDELARAAQNLNASSPPELITREDTYYFTHHTEIAALPAYRLVLDDQERTRYYLDVVSAELVKKVDGNSRGYRWLHEGLHRMDFTPTLRRRPLWDTLMLVLLAGVTAVTITGAWLGIRRMLPRRRRDLATSAPARPETHPSAARADGSTH